MTAVDTGASEQATEERERQLRREVAAPSRIARYALMPVLLALVLAGLALYVSGLELDAIEQRRLGWPFIRGRLAEHVVISAAATAGIVGIAVPVGVVLTRPWARRLTPVAVNLANGGQAIPSLGVLALLFLLLRSLGVSAFQIAIIALVIYGILPVLRNTMVGIQQVDPFEIEAGRGMGMTSLQVLWRIELPLAVPVILAGVRVSLILAVGTATLAWTVGAGGLGQIIQVGISLRRMSVLVVGAVITAALALFIDWLAGVIEDVLRPKGL